MPATIESVIRDAEDISSSKLTWDGADADQLEFMQKVYDINLAWSAANGTFVGDLPEKDLDVIEGKFQAKTAAAAACRDLLAAARKAAKDAGVEVETGLTSAYRSATKQLSLWQRYFPDYYRDTTTYRQTLPGGEHGEKATSYLARYIRPKIAIPGYSNHQNGIAVDILNEQNGKIVANKTKAPYPDEWRKTWLWDWLTSNANGFGFYQNTNINEPWHWEYHEKRTTSRESYSEHEDVKTDPSIPDLIYRDSSPALETLYVKIDLGLRNERIFKKTDPRNDTAAVQQMTGIFIPKNFSASSNIDLLIYLPGHKIEPLPKDIAINDFWNGKRWPHFAYRELLNETGKNLILIAPTLGPRSQAGNLTSNTGFTSFVNQILASLVEYCNLFSKQDPPGINRIIIACHSGSGINMYKIAQLATSNEFAKKITECWGFDCTYGPNDDDALHDWALTSTKQLPKSVFIYYRKKSDTEAVAESLKQMSSGIANVKVTGLPNSTDHNIIPAVYMKERLSAMQDASSLVHEKESELIEAVDDDVPTVPAIVGRKIFETENPIQYTGPSAIAFDLFRRGYISYDIFLKILGGERDVDTLTDLIFDYRHPKRVRLSALVQSSDLDYKKLRTEWNEIKSKIIAPIFKGENGIEKYGEATADITSPRERETEKHDQPRARLKWFNETRFGFGKRQPREDMLVAFNEARQQLRESIAQENLEKLQESFLDTELAPIAGKNNWSPLGPTVIDHGQAIGDPQVSGRITSIEVGPGGQRVYIGSANGGIWRSTDEGKTWKPLDDFSNSPDYISDLQRDSLSIGAIAVKFGKATSGDDDTVYVGTGEPNLTSPYNVFGIGIKRSNKGGADKSWTLEGKERGELAGKGVFKLAIDPDDSSKVFAASTIGMYVRDSKGTWKQIVSTKFTNKDDAVTDFIITGSGSSKQYFAAFHDTGVFRSADEGKTWSAVNGVGSTARKTLAASESNPKIIYLLDENTNLFRLDTSITPLNFEGVNLNSLPAFGQGDYDLILAVDPGNENTIYLAADLVSDGSSYSLSLFKGTITPTTGAFKFSFPFNSANAADPKKDSTFVGLGIHPDGHALAFALDSSGTKHDGKRVWVGCDGGVFYSNANGTNKSFKPMNNGLAITQMTYLTQSPDIPSVIFSGSQDNGTLRLWGDKNWYETAQGDGGGVAIDPSNPLIVMEQYVNADLSISTDGGQTWNPVSAPLNYYKSAESGNTRFYAPIVAIPGSTNTMWLFGSNRLWLSENNGTSWKSLPSATLNGAGGVDTLATSGTTFGTDQIIAIKAVSKDLIYACTANDIYRYSRSAGTWTNPKKTPTIKDWKGVTVTGGNYVITGIDSEGSSANNYYISLGGPGHFSRCYYFDGTTWYPAMSKADRLDIPCSAIVVDPDHPNIVYLGSDVGVWKGVKADKKNSWTWEHFSFGLPEVMILDLKIHNKGRLLRASTHGRGVWEIALDGSGTNKPIDLYLRMNPADNGRMDPRTKKRFDWSVTGKGIPDPYSPGKFLTTALNSPDIQAGPFFPNSSSVVTVAVHNRGWQRINAKDVRVCLLMAAVTSAGTTPLLPKDFVSQINKGNSKKWLDASDWKFADPLQPFSSPLSNIEGHSSQVVSFAPDLTQLNFGSFLGMKMICFAAFVMSSDGSNIVTATDTDIDVLVRNDNHVAQRRAFLP